jgi:hypothetical protein
LDLLRAWSGLEVGAETTAVRNALFINLDAGALFMRFKWYLDPVVRDFDVVVM